jgi:hypothetical protein
MSNFLSLSLAALIFIVRVGLKFGIMLPTCFVLIPLHILIKYTYHNLQKITLWLRQHIFKKGLWGCGKLGNRTWSLMEYKCFGWEEVHFFKQHVSYLNLKLNNLAEKCILICAHFSRKTRITLVNTLISEISRESQY